MVKNRKKIRDIVKRYVKARYKAGAITQALLAMVVVALGIVVTFIFIKLKKPPQQVEQDVLAPLVKVEQLHVRDIPMVIQGYGTVNPKVEVEIIPEVAGKVVHIHPELKVGGLIRANEKILQIDPRDYELAVRQAEATVADATVQLDTEQAEADVARKEWSQLHPGSEPTSPLVLREPQIRKAKATLDSAQAQLATAKLKLERTSLYLPFDALVTSESVDLGQYVVIGQSLAKAYGTEAVEIEVPLETDELAWFDIFENLVFADGERDKAEKTPVKVTSNFAGAEHTWEGYVVRTTGQVDKTSRMISVVVEVPNPFKVSDNRPPLLPGVFAEIMIQGRKLRNAVAVPRDAIREGNKIWLVNDNRLHIRTLKIARTDKDFAYITADLEDGSQIITSSLDVVVDGMQVRTHSDNRNEAEQVISEDDLQSRTEAQ
jgi:multidrug efflux system membrane fusion protein